MLAFNSLSDPETCFEIGRIEFPLNFTAFCAWVFIPYHEHGVSIRVNIDNIHPASQLREGCAQWNTGTQIVAVKNGAGAYSDVCLLSEVDEDEFVQRLDADVKYAISKKIQFNRIKYSSSNLAKRVRDTIDRRHITQLVHFTHIDNIKTIFSNHGILSKENLDKSNIAYAQSDSLQKYKSYVFLSCTVPNSWMLYQKLKTSPLDKTYVILYIDIEALKDKQCHEVLCCPVNSATQYSNTLPIENLELLFSDCVEDMRIGHVFRKDQNLQDKDDYPTHPQAEILIKNIVPLRYIKKIGVPKFNKKPQNLDELERLCKENRIKLIRNVEVFSHDGEWEDYRKRKDQFNGKIETGGLYD